VPYAELNGHRLGLWRKHLPDGKRIDNGLCDVGMSESNFVWVDLRGSEQKQERILDVVLLRDEGRGKKSYQRMVVNRKVS
jgi:hypothetical protein